MWQNDRSPDERELRCHHVELGDVRVLPVYVDRLFVRGRMQLSDGLQRGFSLGHILLVPRQGVIDGAQITQEGLKLNK